jgi:hypothetical protein
MYLNYGSPKVVERLMTTVKAFDRIISVNAAGHLHFNTNWYSGTDSYREGPFEWGKYYSYTVLHPGILMAEYNGDPTGKRFVTGLADGILAHGTQDAAGRWHFPDEINWRTDATRGKLPAGTAPMHLFWAAYKWTHDTKYLRPIIASVEQANSEDSISVGGARVVAEKENLRPLTNFNEDMVAVLGRQDTWGQWAVHRAANGGGNLDRYEAWEMTGDVKYLEDLYGAEMAKAATTMYSQTEGHWWTDRVEVDSQWLQHTRLGGVALTRGNITPGATVSWGFADPEDAVKLALLVPSPKRDQFKVIAFNMSDHPITTTMTGWNVAAGQWMLRQGDGQPRDLPFEKSASTTLTVPPGQTVVYEMQLRTPTMPVEARPDLGIGADDIRRVAVGFAVIVHSLGAKPTPEGRLELIDPLGKIVSATPIPSLPAPTDLMPHTVMVKLALPRGFDPKGCSVHVSLGDIQEITQLNNDVPLH